MAELRKGKRPTGEIRFFPDLVVTWGTRLIGIGLILLGLQCFFLPDVAENYGVSPIDSNGFAYLLATGMRDIALGLMTLFLLNRHRSCLAIYLFIMAIVPIADTVIVLRFGNSISGIVPHLIGIVGIGTVGYSAFLEQRR